MSVWINREKREKSPFINKGRTTDPYKTNLTDLLIWRYRSVDLEIG